MTEFVEEVQTDDARVTVLADITMGRPYALIFMDPQEDTNKLVINVECGGGITNRAELEEFLEAALRYLRES